MGDGTQVRKGYPDMFDERQNKENIDPATGTVTTGHATHYLNKVPPVLTSQSMEPAETEIRVPVSLLQLGTNVLGSIHLSERQSYKYTQRTEQPHPLEEFYKEKNEEISAADEFELVVEDIEESRTRGSNFKITSIKRQKEKKREVKHNRKYTKSHIQSKPLGIFLFPT